MAEGLRTIEGLLDQGWPLRSLLLSERRAARAPLLVTRAEATGAQVLVAPQDVLDRVAGYAVHRGALALAPRPAERDPLQTVADVRVVLVVEGVNDFENLGALFRNAAAFGVGAVLLDPTTADPLYRRCVRVSLGHVMRVPFARLSDWPAGLSEISRAGFSIVGLTPASERSVDELARAAPERVAVMVGSEGSGLTPAALAACDERVRIPMAVGVDSLNVATAAAIALHLLGRVDRAHGDRRAAR